MAGRSSSTPDELQLSQSCNPQHDAFVELMELRKAAARDEIRRRKETIADLQRQFVEVSHHNHHGDSGDVIIATTAPSRRRSVSARLYPGAPSQKKNESHENSRDSSTGRLTPAQVTALGERLSPTPSPTIANLPPMSRRVVTSADFRKHPKPRTREAAQFTDQTALRLACQDPARRAENHQRTIATLELEAKKRFVTHTSKSELQKTVERNYDAAAVYSKKHEHEVDAQLKRVDHITRRTCASHFDSSVVERLRFESAAARKKREQHEREYADNFAPSGTAYLRKTKGSEGAALSSSFQQRLFAELTKGHGFEWRQSSSPSSAT